MSLLSGRKTDSATIYEAARASAQSPRGQAAWSGTTESESDDTGLTVPELAAHTPQPRGHLLALRKGWHELRGLSLAL